jgi:hypothetical protein
MSQQSSSPTAYSWNTRCNCRHSQLALTITLCNHTMLLWPIISTGRVESSNASPLYCLNYTDYRLHTILALYSSLPYAGSNTLTPDWLHSAWLVHLYSPRALRADPPETPLATSVLLSRHVPRHHPGISLVRWRPPSRKRSPTFAQSLLLSDVTCACADTKEILPQDCCVILLGYHATAVAQCLEQIRHNIFLMPNTSQCKHASLLGVFRSSFQHKSNLNGHPIHTAPVSHARFVSICYPHVLAGEKKFSVS